MNRTAILPNTTMQTQKKTGDCEKLSENFLCDEIHSNFRVLAMVCPLSDEFRTVFEKGMFIKPNTKAFPHVLKYLFTICDAIEFKKKFCWPIYNKAAEATFRNSTLDLLNKLNAQYGLGFGEIKFKILIFPGGVEFMRVIFELTRLSMQLILKRNGITNPENSTSISLVSVQKHLDDLENICTFVMDYKKKVQECSVQMKTKTEVLNKLLVNVIANTSITPENILCDGFADRWEELHNDILERGIEPDVCRLIHFQENCQQLEAKISAIFKQHTLKFNENALAAFSMEMQKLYPQQHQQMSNIVENGRCNLDNLLQAFRLALPLIQQSIECYKPRSIEAMSYESNQLQKLSKKSNELLQRIAQISSSESISVNGQTPVKFVPTQYCVAPAFEHIQSMILTTPTISQDVLRRAECAAIQSKRLSLLEDAYQSRPSMLVHNVRPLNSISEESRNNSQCDQKLFVSPARLLNNKDNKESKSKLDPMAMLSTITKKMKMEKHVASSAFRPRAMNFGLQTGIGGGGGGLLECSRTNDTILSVPDFSSTLLNQSTSHDQSKNDQKIRSFMNNSDHDLNCSPSGRIEPLVSSKIQCSGVKPIKELDEQDWNEQMTSPYETPIQRKLTTDVSVHHKHVTRDLSNIENNQNASNKLGAFNFNNMIDDNDESLLNMSDQILNDLALDDSDSR